MGVPACLGSETPAALMAAPQAALAPLLAAAAAVLAAVLSPRRLLQSISTLAASWESARSRCSSSWRLAGWRCGWTRRAPSTSRSATAGALPAAGRDA